MNEQLTKALHSVGFLRDELRQAHAVGNAVESLLLLPMIQKVTELERDIQALENAREGDGANTPAVEKNCLTCAHREVDRIHAPCDVCLFEYIQNDTLPNWEPKP